jgi:hypothetical protein
VTYAPADNAASNGDMLLVFVAILLLLAFVAALVAGIAHES